MFVPRKIREEKLRNLLAEDIGQGDVTADAIVPANLNINAVVLAKAEGIAAGIEEAAILAESLGLKVKAEVADGDKIKKNQLLMEVSGDAQTILSVERTLLNLLSRMSGIATTTRTLIEKLEKSGAKAKIAATRKSPPGMLYFDKRAVVIGGGDPHRLHLDDMILIKDNHLSIVGNVEVAVKKAKARSSFTKKIEVEVTTTEEAMKAAQAGADIIMLDNFSPKKVRDAREVLQKAGFSSVLLEASGGITGKTFLEYAAARVDVISMGELTNSVKALDISLEISKPKKEKI
ncbi:MAG TPA: carboxylating nicotinate-nucleotide diphosphorylase [Candidatus Limnocylindrales bacterium]|nr:carboxylating nicotinate-nucleotide diphosphorylase [Candidatus Limnocylindrales bacterium]